MDGIAYYCGPDRRGVGQTITDNPALLMGKGYAKRVGKYRVSPSESFTLYTSWLGLMGGRRSTDASPNSRWRGVSYFDEVDLFRPFKAYNDFCPNYISLRPRHPSESFSLFTFWLGFDGLEDAKASDQTADPEPAETQPKADPYILYCIG